MEASSTLEDAAVGLLSLGIGVLPAVSDVISPAAASTTIVADPHAGGSPAPAVASFDPVAAWDAEVAAKRKAGLSVAAAVRSVAIEHPQLHADYLAETNSRIRQQRTKTPAAAPAAITAWENAVSEEMRASNCSRAVATRNVATAQQSVHKAYLAAVSDQHWENRRSTRR